MHHVGNSRDGAVMPDTVQLIAAARGGSREALGDLLGGSRRYLLAVADAEVSSQIRVKESPSDIVQETFLDALCVFARFTGQSRRELFAWLRQILLNNAADTRRRYQQTAKRDLRREVPLWQGCDHQAADRGVATGAQLVAEVLHQPLPVIDAVEEPCRQVVLLHHRDGLSFAEVAVRLGRSEATVRKLWLRALNQIRAHPGQHRGGRG